MVSVSSNITTEYMYETPATQGSVKNSAPNSVYEVQHPQAANNETEILTTSTATKKEELEKLCKELGISVDEIFHYPLESLDDTKIQNLIDAVKLAKEHSTKNGNFIKLANKYCIAVSNGYTVQEIKDNPKKLNGENINQRMERFFGLQEGSWSNLSETEKEQYIERYFNQYFEQLKSDAIKKGKDIKNIYKLQMRDFAKLLVNTSDEEKAIFKKAISSLMTENRLQGVFLTLASFETQDARTQWSDSWTTEERAALGKADSEGNIPDSEITTAMQTSIVKEQSQEGLQKSHQDLYTKVTALLEKVNKGEELTEEEKLLYNTYKSLYAGEELGIIMNELINDENWKTEFLNQINNDILTHGEDIYNDILGQIAKTVEKHPEVVTVPSDKIETILNKITGNKYSEQDEKQPAETAEIGFVSRRPANPGRVEELKAQYIQATDKTPQFRVDKNTTSPMLNSTEGFESKIKNAKTLEDKKRVLNEYLSKSSVLKNKVVSMLMRSNQQLFALNNFIKSGSDRFMLAYLLVINGSFKEEDINKLNLSGEQKKLLVNAYEEVASITEK